MKKNKQLVNYIENHSSETVDPSIKFEVRSSHNQYHYI